MRTFLVLSLVSLGAFTAIGRTAPLPAGPAARAGSSAHRLRKELQRTISIELDKEPLPLAIAQLQEQTHIPFVLDRMTLAQNNIDPDEVVVNLKLQDTKVHSVLRAILMPHNLAYAILGDTILISQEDVVAVRQMRQRVNISFDKTPVAQALKQLAQDTATNLVLDPRVAKNGTAPVTLELEDVALETAVRLMAEVVDLHPVRVGNTLFITSKTNAAEMRKDLEGQGEEPVSEKIDKIDKNVIIPRVRPVPLLPPPPPRPAEKKEGKKEAREKKEEPEDQVNPSRSPR
jgi:hypothetical protein